MSDTNTKWKVGAGVALLGTLLMGSLAYNLGSLNQDVHDQRIIGAESQQRENLHKRIDICQEKLKAIKSKNQQQVRETLTKETETLLKEKELLETVMNDYKDVVDLCEANLKEQEDSRAGLPKQEEVIKQLEYENEQMRNSLSSVNTTKEESRKALRTRVRALRLENEQLRKMKQDKEERDEQKVVLEARMTKEREELQDHDYGLGQKGDEDDTGRLRKLKTELSSLQGVKNHDQILAEQTEQEDPDAFTESSRERRRPRRRERRERRDDYDHSRHPARDDETEVEGRAKTPRRRRNIDADIDEEHDDSLVQRRRQRQRRQRKSSDYGESEEEDPDMTDRPPRRRTRRDSW